MLLKEKHEDDGAAPKENKASQAKDSRRDNRASPAKALSEAKKRTAQEVVSALANCYGGLLVDLMGRKGHIVSGARCSYVIA